MIKLIILTVIITFFVLGVIHAYIILGDEKGSDDYVTRLFTSLLWPLCWVAYSIAWVYMKAKKGIKKGWNKTK